LKGDIILAADGVGSLVRSATVTQLAESSLRAVVDSPGLSYCVFDLKTEDEFFKDTIRFLGGSDWMANITPAVTPGVYYVTICAAKERLEEISQKPSEFFEKEAKQLLALQPNIPQLVSQVLHYSPFLICQELILIVHFHRLGGKV